MRLLDYLIAPLAGPRQGGNRTVGGILTQSLNRTVQFLIGNYTPISLGWLSLDLSCDPGTVSCSSTKCSENPICSRFSKCIPNASNFRNDLGSSAVPRPNHSMPAANVLPVAVHLLMGPDFRFRNGVSRSSVSHWAVLFDRCTL